MSQKVVILGTSAAPFRLHPIVYSRSSHFDENVGSGEI